MFSFYPILAQGRIDFFSLGWLHARKPAQNFLRPEGQRGPWKVKITAYPYTLEESKGGEMISWHPTGPGALPYPHLHLGAAVDVGRAELEGAHIPTGRVALEQVLRFAIETFRVRTVAAGPAARHRPPSIGTPASGLEAFPAPSRPPNRRRSSPS